MESPPLPPPKPRSHFGEGSGYYSTEFSACNRVYYHNSGEDEGELLGQDEAEVVYCH